MALKASYGNQNLWLPKGFHNEFVSALVRNTEGYTTFSRQVDLWWYALGMGVSIQRRVPIPQRTNLVKIHDGVVLEADPWRITHLELLALAEEGQGSATNPIVVVQIANEYVISGCEVISQALRGRVEKQMFLLDFAQNCLENSFTP